MNTSTWRSIPPELELYNLPLPGGRKAVRWNPYAAMVVADDETVWEFIFKDDREQNERWIQCQIA